MKKIFSLILIISTAFILCACGENYSDGSIFVGNNQQYKTLSAALENCPENGQIVVNSGKYFEDLTIDKPVRIVGRSNSVSICGGIKLSSGGLQLKKIVLDGKNSNAKHGIEILANGEIDAINISNCSIKNFKGCGIKALTTSASPFNVKNVRIEETKFVKNAQGGMFFNNISAANILKCDFEQCATSLERVKSDFSPAAFGGDFSSGESGGVVIKGCNFFKCGNETLSESGAISLRKGEGGDYKGAAIIDDCLFLQNTQDAISGKSGSENSAVKTSIINKRGLRTRKVDNAQN